LRTLPPASPRRLRKRVSRAGVKDTREAADDGGSEQKRTDSATVGDAVHDSAAGSGVVETTAPAAAVGGGDGRRRRPADAAMEGEPFSHMIDAATNTSPPSRGSTTVEIGGYSFDVPADLVQCFEMV
jgi:hypothetical protein